MGPRVLLELRGISKAFPGVQALQDVDLTVEAGEVHALVGENGAGKSTLVKILAGLYSPDSGSIVVYGQPYPRWTPGLCRRLGIFFVHQERQVVPFMSVTENLFLGSEPALFLGRTGRPAMVRRAVEVLRYLDVALDPFVLVGSLSVAEQLAVEFGRLLISRAQVVILDEPTASLSTREIERLLSLVQAFKARGIGVLFISHKLDEVFRISDRITVLRDGKKVGTLKTAEATPESIVRLMVGRQVASASVRASKVQNEPMLVLDSVSDGKRVHRVSFAVQKGEIFCIFGVVGAGKTELGEIIFGARPMTEGSMLLRGRPFSPKNPQDAVRAGIAFVPEDRRRSGVFPNLSVIRNISIAALSKCSRFGLLRPRKERDIAHEFSQRLAIKARGPDVPVRYLSGGNQQKVIVARWMAVKADLYIFDQPTVGVDVAAREEIYLLIERLAEQGKAVIVLSSDASEVIRLADEVAVMRSGRIAARLRKGEVTTEVLFAYAMGGEDSATAPSAALVGGAGI